jgi:hypothetical protein
MIQRGVLMLSLMTACIFFGSLPSSAAAAATAATPMPMNMNMGTQPSATAQPNQMTQDPEAGIASPVSNVDWSVFNHRGAGFFLFFWGFTALVAGLMWPRRTWLNYVPGLVLLGLVEFLFLRNDPKAWPSGPYGFWMSFQDPSVLQHRIFVVLLIVLAVVELLRAADLLPPLLKVWAVPAIAVFGGVYLFFHTHGGIETQQMMQHMSDPGMANNPAMQKMTASMHEVKHEHLYFSLLGFGLAAAKLLADGGLIKGRLGATLWTFFAMALGVYMFAFYTE